MGPHENSGQPTKKKVKRDINALMRGTKDGEVIIKNIKPKTSGGTHEVIDETFKSNASFKETDEGEIN
jgi:ribosomal protein S24E